MKIALIGYGKMGKTIEKIATTRGHEIVLKVGIENLEDFTSERVKEADVAIEFTGPDAAFENLKKLMKLSVPTVCGSTGWLNHYDEICEICNLNSSAFLYASNFSIGVNVFFAVNKLLAKLMATYPEYEPTIEEIHHTAKLDAPSGTAITLAEQVLQHNQLKKRWTNHLSDDKTDLVISSIRQDPAPGTHTVSWQSAIDEIQITHTAHSRDGFALGAVLAAEFLVGRHGIFTMADVLNT